MTKSIRPGLVTALAVLSLALSCSPMQGSGSGENQEIDYGDLEIINVTTTPRIDSLTFQGSFRNQFEQPVDGIRVVLLISQDPSEKAPILARAHKVLDTHLEPDEHTPFEITAKIRPNSLNNAGLRLYGFAIRRGGEELPVSPLWDHEP